MGDIVELSRYLKKEQSPASTAGDGASVFYIDDAFKDRKQKMISALENRVEGSSALANDQVYSDKGCDVRYGPPLEIAAMARWNYDECRYREAMQCVDCMIESGPQEKNELIALFDLVNRLYMENFVHADAVKYLIGVCSEFCDDEIMMRKRVARLWKTFRPFLSQSIHVVRPDEQMD